MPPPPRIALSIGPAVPISVFYHTMDGDRGSRGLNIEVTKDEVKVKGIVSVFTYQNFLPTLPKF